MTFSNSINPSSGKNGGLSLSSKTFSISGEVSGVLSTFSSCLKAPIVVTKVSGSNALLFAADENKITLSIANPMNGGTTFTALVRATQADGSGVLIPVTVTNTDPVPQPYLTLSGPVIQPEGNSGTTSFAWTLTLTRDGHYGVIAYDWSVAGSGARPADTADFGGAFPTGSGSFDIAETTETIIVPVSGDSTGELDETFTLTVTASGLSTVTSIGTISNDDGPG